jgi:peptidyl-prolyl cis-trans isomerase D
MMSMMRETASGWVVKVLIGLLVLSFAAWGIGDIFTHAQRDTTIAKIGGTKITLGEFQQEYQQKISELKMMMGASYNPEFIKSLNMGQQTLNSLIDKTLITKESEALGLMIGEDAIQDEIRSNHNFQNESGRFDLAVFQRALQNAQISEKTYYDGLKMQIKAELMLGALSGKQMLPASLIQYTLSQKLEKREASVVVIPASSVGTIPEPSDKEINELYEQTKHTYTESEYREGKYITVPFADVLASVTVSPEDVSRSYKDRIEDFRQPEKRGLEQLLYDTKENAEKAYALLAEGKTVAEAANKFAPQNAGKLSLGELRKAELPAQAREIVFALKEKQFSKPVQSDFGWHIFYVLKIIPEGVSPLASVQARIEADLKQHEAEESLYKTVNTLTDSLAAGSSIEAAAKEVGLSVGIIPSIDKNGMTPQGKKVDSIPSYSNFVSTLFNTEEKNQSAITMAQDGSHFVVQTDKIVPERIKSLAEVKPLVISAWKQQRASTLLREKADALAASMQKLKPQEAIEASGLNVSLQSIGTIARDATKSEKIKTPLPVALVEQLFALSRSEVTSAVPAENGGYIIGVVNEILPPQNEDVAKATTERDQLAESLRQQYQGELYLQYIRFLRDKYKVQVYEDRLPTNLTNE